MASADLRPHPGSHYYEHWLRALERLLCARGILDAHALD
jgi:hypothetical protein